MQKNAQWTRIRGGNVLAGDRILENTDVWIEDGTIAAIGQGPVFSGEAPYRDADAFRDIGASRDADACRDPAASCGPVPCRDVDASGLYVSPGFVDIHQHGGGGSDYMDEDGDAYSRILSVHVKHGTTSVMPTLSSCGMDTARKAVRRYCRALQDERIRCNLLGLHMEGPYLSPAQAGAQYPDAIREFDPKEYHALYEASEGHIRRWSVAPEKKGVEEFAHFAEENGIVLSIAHSDADFDTVLRAYELGFHHVTHLYSGMSPVFRRKGFRVAGIVEAAFYLDGMNVELIADGCHLPLSLLKLVHKIKPEGTVALITDAIRAAGMEETGGEIVSAKEAQPFIVEDGVAKMLDREAFVGSIATADRLVRTMCSAGIPLTEAVQMVTDYPLRMMNRTEKKGAIRVGYDADLCLFDQDIKVKAVMIHGEWVE